MGKTVTLREYIERQHQLCETRNLSETMHEAWSLSINMFAERFGVPALSLASVIIEPCEDGIRSLESTATKTVVHRDEIL